MSIITDTLNRLQSSWTKRPAFDSATKPGAYSRPEPSHQAPKKGPGRLKFLGVFFGLTIAFTAMGFGMFWFGMNGAPEVSRRSHSSPLPKPQLILEELPVPADSIVNPPESQRTTPPGPDASAPSPTQKPLEPSPSNTLALPKEGVVTPAVLPENPSSEPDTKAMTRSTRAKAPASAQPSKPEPSPALSQAPTIAEPNNQETAEVSLKKIQDSSKRSPSLKSETEALGQSDSISSSVTDHPKKQPPMSAKKEKDGQASSKGSTAGTMSSSPDSDAERLARGRSLVKQRLYSEAVVTLNPLFATLPHQWEPWFWMGTAHMGLRQYDEAKEAFREGLARNETIPQLWVQLAIVEHQYGRYSQALAALRQAELLTPNLPEVQLNLGFTLEGQGKAKSALHHYRQYLSLTDRNPVHLSTRKKVLDRIIRLERS